MDINKVVMKITNEINNKDNIYKIFTSENISEIFVQYDDGKKGCRVQREYNWGYTGEMCYYAVDPKDPYLENVCNIDPSKIIGVREMAILQSGIWHHFRYRKNNLYYLSDAWLERWTLVKQGENDE